MMLIENFSFCLKEELQNLSVGEKKLQILQGHTCTFCQQLEMPLSPFKVLDPALISFPISLSYN